MIENKYNIFVRSMFLDTCWKFDDTLKKFVQIWKVSNKRLKFTDTRRKLWAIWTFLCQIKNSTIFMYNPNFQTHAGYFQTHNGNFEQSGNFRVKFWAIPKYFLRNIIIFMYKTKFQTHAWKLQRVGFREGGTWGILRPEIFYSLKVC